MTQIIAIPPPLLFICLSSSDDLEKVIYDRKYATWRVEELYGNRCDFVICILVCNYDTSEISAKGIQLASSY